MSKSSASNWFITGASSGLGLSLAKFETFLNNINGRQPGDPDKCAAAILAIAAADKPPRRLLLGRYAYDKFAKNFLLTPKK